MFGLLIKKILVPIDGSKYAEKALDFALEMANMCHADLKIITVVPELVDEPDWMKDYTEKMKENGNVMLSNTFNKAKESNPELKISKNLMEGDIVTMILDCAKKGNYDLIVMGSRGLGTIKRFLLGSVSNSVVNQAEIPVLIVK